MNADEMIIPAVGWRPFRGRHGLDVSVSDPAQIEEAKRRLCDGLDLPAEMMLTGPVRRVATVRCADGYTAHLIEGDTFSVNPGFPSEIVLRFRQGVVEEKIPDLDVVRELARQERWRMEHQTCEDLPVVLPSTIVCPCGASYLPGETVDL